jgi:hypothetical protein
MGQHVKDMPEGMTLNELTGKGYVSMGINNIMKKAA